MEFFHCPSCEQLYIKAKDKTSSLTCCDESLSNLKKNIASDETSEHYPNIKKIGNFVTITIGENHPMINVHHVSVILLQTNQGFQYKNLQNNSHATAKFILAKDEVITNVYAYCNVNMLWSLY